MIVEYVYDMASQMGIQLEDVTVSNGRSLECQYSYFLDIISNGKMVSALVHKSELDNLGRGSQCDLFEFKIKSTLLNLKMMSLRNCIDN